MTHLNIRIYKLDSKERANLYLHKQVECNQVTVTILKTRPRISVRAVYMVSLYKCLQQKATILFIK